MGPERVALGIYLVYAIEGFSRFFEGNKEKYWVDNGKPLTAFLQPEQLREVTEGLLKRDYAESGERGILGKTSCAWSARYGAKRTPASLMLTVLAVALRLED